MSRTARGRQTDRYKGHDQPHDHDRGSGTVLMLGLAGVASMLMVVALGLGAAVTARHRAAAAADLAALAAIDSGEGCPAAGRIATANQAHLASCESAPDGTVVVSVTVKVAGLGQDARSSARAGPGPAQIPGPDESVSQTIERRSDS
ncbi:Rv3654c family TadE-like protein [Kineosporia babensis]|uniref:Flp pilus-assembly TadE/G-like family protein n=1 Tax=Kineosporia babensis TaxID=499548 RepID=A0A9X1SUA1_9ACTN|nr:Rv3654c family TadE-like protein [Kineosporia babensis]MCD5312699.1 flp pilus-assembly TadE/G-like family protein [Kineosporia babensis]